jgi:hypothetical protein
MNIHALSVIRIRDPATQWLQNFILNRKATGIGASSVSDRDISTLTAHFVRP